MLVTFKCCIAEDDIDSFVKFFKETKKLPDCFSKDKATSNERRDEARSSVDPSSGANVGVVRSRLHFV